MKCCLALAVLVALSSCTSSPPTGNGCLTATDCPTGMACVIGRCALATDAGQPDGAAMDAPTIDSSASDTGASDTGASDAGASDTSVDAVATDAWPIDASTVDASACPARPPLGLYVWDDDLSAPARTAILDLAESRGITELYLHANLFYVGDLGSDVLVAWIDAAHARCMEVELLFADASWILPAGNAEAAARAQWAVSFARAHPGSAPAGVHFDLEPQQLTAAWGDVAMRPVLVADLATLYESITPPVEAAGLRLTADIGFFLDGVDVTRTGIMRPGHEWITDAVSRVVVLDYRDSAVSTGHGGMIDLAQTEVDYASTVGCPIVLAAETNVVSPGYVTYLEEGLAAMLTQLAIVRTHFTPSSSFAGLAIHDHTGLAALAP